MYRRIFYTLIYLILEKYSFASFITTGLNNAKAIKFGIAMSPFNVSAIPHAKSSFTVPAIQAKIQKITWYTFDALKPNKYSTQRVPYKAQARTVDKAKSERQIATATAGNPVPNTDSNPMIVKLAPMSVPYPMFYTPTPSNTTRAVIVQTTIVSMNTSNTP